MKTEEKARIELEIMRAIKHADFANDSEQWRAIEEFISNNYPDDEELIDHFANKFFK